MTSYDYIIVGAGSAGCVLAHRLSQDAKVRVLLLEAGGPDTAREIHVPAAFSKLFKTAADWAYFTEEQPGLNNRKLYWPRGKVLGGSSSINAMIYIRGNRRDYDRWAELGATGWNWESVARFFEHTLLNLNVTSLATVNPISKAFIEAAVEAGFAHNSDFNDRDQEGFGLYSVTQQKGQRHSAADAFLRPDRPNLTVLTGALATRVLIDGRRARGIEYLRDGRTEEVRAEREVVLAGGAVNSPQLLMLSGIGPADQLRGLDIDVVADLPGVGENLQDHPVVPVCYRATKPVSLANATSLSNVIRYLVAKSGKLASNVAECGGFVRTRDGLDRPDIQFHFAPGFFLDHGFRTVEGHGFTFGPTLVRPQSVGWLRLRSSDPTDPPLIQPNYLAAGSDLQSLIDGLRIGRKIVRAKAMETFRGEEFCPGSNTVSDSELADYVRANVETLYHPAGTCKMGSDKMAVVDPELRVHGIDSLRVVDASVMPEMVTGNTNAPTMMIAEKAADMITHIRRSHATA